MAFLEVITRTFGQRPRRLADNLESLKQQTDRDWMRTLIVDDERRGVAWAVGNLRTVEATGDYVWVLDDDDICSWPQLVDDLKRTAEEADWPDVIMVRALHERYGLLPSDDHWEQPPVLGNIGTSCYVVRREVWNAHRAAWVERYDGDFYFVEHLWQQPGLRWYWLNVIAAYYPQQSIGAAESDTADKEIRDAR
jgi:hypothetical protein